MAARTLYDKIWDDHVVDTQPDGTSLIYIDRHLVHEVTSPQAFEGLRTAGRKVHAPDKTLAVVDHNVPTTDRSKGISDPDSANSVATLENNARQFGIEYFGMRDYVWARRPPRQREKWRNPAHYTTRSGTSIWCTRRLTAPA